VFLAAASRLLSGASRSSFLPQTKRLISVIAQTRHRLGSAVFELRVPVGAAAVRRLVEVRPDRPHDVDVPRVLAGVRRSDEELAAPAVVELLVIAGEDRG
jgi:hypothetical protein